MEWLKKSWRRTPPKVRKPLILLLGVTVVVTGIILLPLPGPGWVIIFAGFAILATEFESAEKVRDWLIARLQDIIRYCKHAWQKLTHKK
ncbi:MAG TPA: TIGR02611 family protein [Candidatus Saccharimonadales bacterium]|nr:TIGR02611 family protein [Candidatus Saccharimonadales bacterium]